jgi:hypothetical protein
MSPDRLRLVAARQGGVLLLVAADVGPRYATFSARQMVASPHSYSTLALPLSRRRHSARQSSALAGVKRKAG